MASKPDMREFTHSLVIKAPPAAVLDAFFDAEAMAIWWQVSRAVCTPRPLGSYAVEWEPTDWRDEILGRLGGAFHGTVMEFRPGREFFVAEPVLAAARRGSHRPDGARSDLSDPGRSGAAPAAPVRVRRVESAMVPVLRHRVGELGVRPRGVEEVPGRPLGIYTFCTLTKFDGPCARSGVMLTSTTTDPAGTAPARDEHLANAARRGADIPAQICEHRHHPPRERQNP